VIATIGLYIAAVINTRKAAQKFLDAWRIRKLGVSATTTTIAISLHLSPSTLLSQSRCTPAIALWNFAFPEFAYFVLALATWQQRRRSLTFDNALLSTRGDEYLRTGRIACRQSTFHRGKNRWLPFFPQ